MKKFIKINICLLTLIFTYLLIAVSCKKNENSSIPVLTTAAVSSIQANSAISGGNVISEGGSAIIVRGLCWSKNLTPTIADNLTTIGPGEDSFTSSMTGLSNNTVYYARAYAVNSAGTGYGGVMCFTTPKESITVTDIDGNVYQTIKVGGLIWTKENLKTIRYNDGTQIPYINNSSTWSSLASPGYCYYNNDPGTYKDTYGSLYNWYAVKTGKLCPAGWHVPSDKDWQVLIDSLGGDTYASGKLKETGTLHWNSPNSGATNSSYFTALPGGYRGYNGSYYYIGNLSYFWSTSPEIDYNALSIALRYNNVNVIKTIEPKKEGYSIRCVKN